MEEKKWYQELNLSQCGMYYEGFVEEMKLSATLEKHRRGTASTFGTRKSSRVASQKDENMVKAKAPSFFWRYTAGNAIIQFEGTPFSIGENRIMDCQHGEHYYKPKKSTNKQVRLQGTRKKGCTTHITVRQYILYPEYSVLQKFESKRQERLAKEDALVQLRDCISSGKPVEKKMYYVSLPLEEAHHDTHPTRGAHFMAQRVNPNIAIKISELVSEGMVDSYEIRKALKHYVNVVMCASTTKPDPDDRAYYPTIRDIQNHVYKAKKALDLSKFDQQNLKMKIEAWEEQDPQSKFYFRPFMKAENLKDEFTDENVLAHKEFEQSLLWVHQTEWQRQMLTKYGNTMTLMDATYKVTKYDIPLFFLTVRTNAGYTVVAEFIVQTEMAAYIQEALTVIKNWNPNWKPSFFMCDYSEAEILSLETVFPNTFVYICDFHREQCWERWVKDHKHGLTENEGAQLLDLLRDCSSAPPSRSVDQEVYHNYHFAVEQLKASQVWLQHEQVQAWLNNYWLPIAKRWARAYRDQRFHECINTNNGTEALNKALKYTYLPRAKRGMNLSGIATLLVDTFLPALRQKYLFSNFEQCSANRKYKDSIPSYLHNRPKAVILHCLDRKTNSSKFEPKDVSVASEGVFKVQSGDNAYTVDFKTPSCTCPDWIQTNYPCKHFFAVFRNHPSWDWNALPTSYLETPRLKLDSKAVEEYFSHPQDGVVGADLENLDRKEESIVSVELEDYTGNITKNKSFSREFKEQSTKARITLKAIESLTYSCTDPQLLKNLNAELQRAFNTFRSSLPEEEGVVILPALRRRVKASTIPKHLSSIPPYKKHGRKRLNSLYRNRVGRRANRLRKAAQEYLRNRKKGADLNPVQEKEERPRTSPTKAPPVQRSTFAGKKRGRCGICTGCKAEECQVCPMCLDKPKYGGPGKKKQCCIQRKCCGLQPSTQGKLEPRPQLVNISNTKLLDNTPMSIPSTHPASKHSLLKLNSRYVKLPGATFPDELPVNAPTTKRVLCFDEASKFLESYDRKIHPILGDGNCLFRALSHLILWEEDYHQQIRKLLIDFIVLNQDIFCKFCKERTLEEHVAHMKYDTIWGTDIEIRAAASYLQRPIYVCTQRSRSLEYYWDYFAPLTTRMPTSGDYFDNIYHSRPLPIHLEICHSNRCHYDVITMSDGSPATSPPAIYATVDHIDLTTES